MLSSMSFFYPGDDNPVEVSDVLKIIRGDDSSSASFIGPVVGEMIVDNKGESSRDARCVLGEVYSKA